MKKIAQLTIFLLLALWIAAPVAAQKPEQEAAVYKDWALGRARDAGHWILEQRVYIEGNPEMPLVQIAIQDLGIDEQKNPETLWAMIRVPLGILLSPGLQIKIDEAEPVTFSVHHCRTGGCIAFLRLTQQLRQKLEAGREARITFQLLNGQGVGVPVSLMGIRAGLAALEKKIETE